MDDPNTVEIFSIPISSVTKEQLYFILHGRMTENRQTSIATVNPEILLQAKQSKQFSETLKKCTLRLVDGFGISFVSYVKKHKKLSRCVGRDAVDVCCALAAERHLNIGVIGGSVGISGKAATALHAQYPDVHFIDLSQGGDIIVNEEGKVKKGAELVEEVLKKNKIGIVFAGFGAKKQESWILQFLKNNQNCQCGIGVGGILDVLSGKVKKPPVVFSALGLEWLWRLGNQPSRFTRIINAVIVFPFKAFFYE